ncbi:ABC-type sugar transport system ATPase subunit [Paraburkholderia tropica]|uniref:sugar ABC transporter ATP-binding protein n=1 Tax=Paraburkholderia tropica TaxID=92647 RepID=UPI00161A6413|nr:sugar ABC transporter ATP-binding protein [Paraburkholderia tropica]MBB3001187.1 ABC-type sugar transport system ATPase subunit [Paraburkholderia tropica]MBB6320819.1 ABC-type sugar transport system ATPase subunit [Paraburkholderia tropica]
MSIEMASESARLATTARIEVRGLSRSFGASIALKPFTHTFEPGQIHALMGKNGSGKSTLLKILAGSIRADAGKLIINDEECDFHHPSDAFDAGIRMVHQELSLVPTLSVAENIFLGRLPLARKGLVRGIDWKQLREDAARMLESTGLEISPDALVSTLPVGQQQMIEIVKAYATSPAVLLLDEPTSALSHREVERLFMLVRRLRSHGVTMLYITHRMNEIFDIADTCTVLRDGDHISSLPIAQTSPKDVVRAMFGEHHLPARVQPRQLSANEPALSVRNLHRKGAFDNIHFDLRRGEVLGIAGMLGAGRTELLRSIFGADPLDGGTIELHGETVDSPSPSAMKRRGLGYTPENRKEHALVQAQSIHANLCMAGLARLSRFGFVNSRMEAEPVRRQIAEMAIKAQDAQLPVSSMSGGNQQKVVLGNWFNTNPRVMFFDEPSRGIDIQAKEQIFNIIREKALHGMSAIVVSSEPEELLEVCDRILVMHHGRFVAEVDPQTIALDDLYQIMMEGVQ